MARRIGFLPLGSSLWQAGTTYLENLLSAVTCAQTEARESGNEREDAKTVLFLPPSTSPVHLGHAPHLVDEIVPISFEPFADVHSWKRCLVDQKIGAFFSRYGQHFEESWGVPRMGWIVDFQHIHLPEMTRPELLQKRDAACRITADRAETVVVSSSDALNDLKNLDADALSKAEILRPVAKIDANIYSIDPSASANRFHLGSRFFFLPNQIWKHKNHRTVIEALALLRERGCYPVVVCSGNTNDHRDPEYFSHLLEMIARLGLREQMIFLGTIDHAQVLSLARQSLAVLNPSLFEGWSTTVEEAKSLGKAMILSDLAVHLEQDPPASHYFLARSPQSLADILAKVWLTGREGPDFALEERARQELAVRQRTFGRTFLAMVDRTFTRRVLGYARTA
jgi:glycosyltransferase involved in cell wall biosynthesis